MHRDSLGYPRRRKFRKKREIVTGLKRGEKTRNCHPSSHTQKARSPLAVQLKEISKKMRFSRGPQGLSPYLLLRGIFQYEGLIEAKHPREEILLPTSPSTKTDGNLAALEKRARTSGNSGDRIGSSCAKTREKPTKKKKEIHMWPRQGSVNLEKGVTM